MAEPINFVHSNLLLKPPKKQNYSKNIESVVDLPAWSDGEQCVSCWRPTVRERLSILFFGRVWLSVLSGRTQPPVYITGTKTYLREE